MAGLIDAIKTIFQGMNTNSGPSEAYLVLDEEVLGKLVYRLNSRESNRVGVTLIEGSL